MENDNIVNVAMDKDYYDQVMSGGGNGGGNSAMFIHINNAMIEQLPEEYINLFLNANKEAYNLCYNYIIRTATNFDFKNPPTVFYYLDTYMLPVAYGSSSDGTNHIIMIVYNLNFANDDVMIVKYRLYSDGHTELVQE